MLWLPGVPVSVATRVVVAAGAQLGAGDGSFHRKAVDPMVCRRKVRTGYLHILKRETTQCQHIEI